MRVDIGKITLWDKAFQDTETTAILSEGYAKVLKAAQLEPIQVKGFLNSASEQSLLNQQFVLQLNACS